MTLLEPTITLAQTVAEGAAPEVLDEIWSPGCAAAIWHRKLDAQFQQWLDALAPEQLPEARLVSNPHGVEGEVGSLCARHGIGDSPYAKQLAEDVGRLARVYARILKADLLGLRLDVLNDDACRKFHVDNVEARLLCTYRGRGTEYGRAPAGEHPDRIHHVPAGAVGLFRGGLWSGGEHCGIAHRSPQISGLGETRLLLVIDPATTES